MNLVGKIFTVLIFLMCVVFGTFALMVHAAHQNWREVVMAPSVGLNDQLINANKEKQGLLDEKKILQTTLENERKDIQKRLIALEQAARDAIAERDKDENKIAAKDAEARRLTMTIDEIQKRLGVLQVAIDGMRTDIKVTVDERNKVQSELVDTTDKLMNSVAEREKLEKLQRQLVDQINKLKEMVQYAKITQSSLAKVPPEGQEGEVTAVPKPDVVEISIGADQGVRKGFRYVVTRPSAGFKYIGVIEVIQVEYPNRAVCRPDKGVTSDQIQRGDHVKAYTKPG